MTRAAVAGLQLGIAAIVPAGLARRIKARSVASNPRDLSSLSPSLLVSCRPATPVLSGLHFPKFDAACEKLQACNLIAVGLEAICNLPISSIETYDTGGTQMYPNAMRRVYNAPAAEGKRDPGI